MKISTKLIGLAQNVISLQVAEQAIKNKVEPIQTAILKEQKYKDVYSAECGLSEGEYEPIVYDFNNVCDISEKDCDQYIKLLHEAYINAGYDVKFGYCPLLIASNNTIKAVREMLIEAEPITKIKYRDSTLDQEIYNQLIKIVLALCAPHI